MTIYLGFRKIYRKGILNIDHEFTHIQGMNLIFSRDTRPDAKHGYRVQIQLR